MGRNKLLDKHISKNNYSKLENDNDYIFKNLKFIWGIKSPDDLSSSEANIWTMNDIEIYYDDTNKKYTLSIEAIYYFDNGKKGEIKYLKRLLNEFTKYMIDNNYNINEEYPLQYLYTSDMWSANSIPELYARFKIFVNGYERI